MDNSRAQWGSKLGFILAAAGSAIGLGNIWKFPGRAFEGGGGTYVLIYLCMVIFLGAPLMLTELSIGRASQANVVGAFRNLGHKRWSWVGWVGVIVAFIITCYYSHVGGWVLRYVCGYTVEAPTIYADPLGYFYATLGLGADGNTFFPWVAILFAALFMVCNAVVIIRGVEGGIERFNKIGMPALFVILIVLLVRSPKNTALICAMDTLVAILAGFIIIPAVFATLGPDQVGKGGGFAFVSLAGVFESMPGGRIFGVLFYLLLLFAALTSCISLIESIVAFLTEHFSWERKATTIWVCFVMFLIGCLYTCSQAAYPLKGVWYDAVNGVTFPALCDAMEYLTDRLMIPFCALGCCLFAGWVWKPESAIAEIEQHGVRFGLKKVYSVLIKFVAPIAILAILVLSLVTGTTLS